VLRGQFDYPTLRAKATEYAGRYKPTTILVEDAGVGTALVPELINAGFSTIGVRPDRDKLTRMAIQAAKFESGRVLLPTQASWLDQFEAELFALAGEEADEIRGRHVPVCRGESGIPGHVAAQRVEEREVGLTAGHQASNISGAARIAAKELMVAEQPQIAGLADRHGLTPLGIDLVLRISSAVFEIGLNMIDLGRLEAEYGDVKPLYPQQVCQFRDFDRQALAIPSRVLCKLVVGDRKGTPFRRRKSGHNDSWDLVETELHCRCVAAMSGDELTILAHQHRGSEPERGDAIGDLADLLGRMRPRIPRSIFPGRPCCLP
jgi:hypothetical protein